MSGYEIKVIDSKGKVKKHKRLERTKTKRVFEKKEGNKWIKKKKQ